MIQTLLRIGIGSVMVLALIHSGVTSTNDSHRPVVQIKTEAVAVQNTPKIQIAANKTPASEGLSLTVLPRRVASPKPKPSLIPTPMSPSPSPFMGDDVWTPYNAHCQADCFPDLTPNWMNAVDGYYQGSFEAPGPNGPEFKGLPNPPLDHYVCEYGHVVGDLTVIVACKGIL